MRPSIPGWLGFLGVVASSCVAPVGEAPDPPRDTGCARDVDCPPFAGAAVTCEGGRCFARAYGGETFADCDRAGAYLNALSADAAHCGACHHACAAGEACSAGACVGACPAGAADRCGADCVDRRTDAAHCGACGNRCPAGAPCVDGRCACPPGEDRCGARCVDLSSDAANCGACGEACEDGTRCEAGRCACADPLRYCGSRCVDERSDPRNCGACGAVCPAYQACDGGRCAPCPVGRVLCGERCVDLRTDLQHCGECGRACGDVCEAGACRRCYGGLSACGGRCEDLETSRSHCGACGRACGEAQRCARGVCVGCAAGQTRCDNACADLQTDAAHCGRCGAACPWSERCVAGRCEPPCRITGGRCGTDGCDTDLAHSDYHCGACGVRCAVGARCLDGRCVASAPRLVAPLAMARVSSPRPWFRWELAGGADGARVEVCADRACERVEARWDASGDRARPPEALAPGRHFWRAHLRRGAEVDGAASLPWQFAVHAADAPAGHPFDTLRDIDGDGRDDDVFGVPCDPPAPDVDRCAASALTSPTPASAAWRARPAPPPSDPTAWSYRASYVGHSPLGDVNGDGHADVILLFQTLSSWQGWGRDVVVTGSLFLGGASGLGAVPVGSLSGEASRLQSVLSVGSVGDRNGDGYGDMSVVTATGTTFVPAYRDVLGGRGALGYAPPAGGCVPSLDAMVVADFDADGRSDIAYTDCSSAPRAFYVELGDADPAARWSPAGVDACGARTTYGWRPRLRVADVNDDGFDDLRIAPNDPAAADDVFLGGPGGLSATRCVVAR